MTLCRTWLFVPGNQEGKLEKSTALATDCIIYDLEDSVPAGEKAAARSMVKSAIGRHPSAKAYVRVNPCQTNEFVDDVRETVSERLTGVMLPKANTKEDIAVLDEWLSALEEERALAGGSVRIVPLIETALGLHHAFDIAVASSRVERLAFGAVDFVKDIRAERTDEGWELMYARTEIVVKSRAGGIESPVDTVFTDIRDTEGLGAEAALARRLGFAGKLVIHPGQLERVRQAFTPTAGEIAEALTICRAYDEALKAGTGAVQLDGKLIDVPVVEHAKQIVEKARLLGLL